MLEKAGKDLGALRAIAAMEKMSQLEVDIRTETKCTGISNEGVLAIQKHGSVVIPCENVAVGSRFNDSSGLTAVCSEHGVAAR